MRYKVLLDCSQVVWRVVSFNHVTDFISSLELLCLLVNGRCTACSDTDHDGCNSFYLIAYSLVLRYNIAITAICTGTQQQFIEYVTAHEKRDPSPHIHFFGNKQKCTPNFVFVVMAIIALS